MTLPAPPARTQSPPRRSPHQADPALPLCQKFSGSSASTDSQRHPSSNPLKVFQDRLRLPRRRPRPLSRRSRRSTNSLEGRCSLTVRNVVGPGARLSGSSVRRWTGRERSRSREKVQEGCEPLRKGNRKQAVTVAPTGKTLEVQRVTWRQPPSRAGVTRRTPGGDAGTGNGVGSVGAGRPWRTKAHERSSGKPGDGQERRNPSRS